MLGQKGTSEKGFSLVEMVVVVAVLGILVAIVVPALLSAVDRSRQRRSMADMANIARASGMYQVDNGRFPPALAALQPDYMGTVPPTDGWGAGFVYTPAGNQRSYQLISLGKDGALGPAAPPLWMNEPFEVDLIMDTGQFIQMPSGQ